MRTKLTKFYPHLFCKSENKSTKHCFGKDQEKMKHNSRNMHEWRRDEMWNLRLMDRLEFSPSGLGKTEMQERKQKSVWRRFCYQRVYNELTSSNNDCQSITDSWSNQITRDAIVYNSLIVSGNQKSICVLI